MEWQDGWEGRAGGGREGGGEGIKKGVKLRWINTPGTSCVAMDLTLSDRWLHAWLDVIARARMGYNCRVIGQKWALKRAPGVGDQNMVKRLRAALSDQPHARHEETQTAD